MRNFILIAFSGIFCLTLTTTNAYATDLADHDGSCIVIHDYSDNFDVCLTDCTDDFTAPAAPTALDLATAETARIASKYGKRPKKRANRANRKAKRKRNRQLNGYKGACSDNW